MTAELATLPTARLVRPLVLRWPSCLASALPFCGQRSRHTRAPCPAPQVGRLRRAAARVHCVPAHDVAAAQADGAHGLPEGARPEPPLVGSDRSVPVPQLGRWPAGTQGVGPGCSTHPESPRARRPPPLLVVAAYLYGAAVSACQRRSFPAVSHPGPGSGSSTWCHASRRGAATRSAPPWELAPPPPRCSPPLPRRRSRARSRVAAVLVLSVVGTPCIL